LQHFLGLAGNNLIILFFDILNINWDTLIYIYNIITSSIIPIDNLFNNFVSTFVLSKYNKNFPFGPHVRPQFLKEPIRLYENPNLERNLIGLENKKRSIIYQWLNLITGKIYIGSAWNGSTRLLSYWTPSVIRKNYPIYNNLTFYGHSNFALAILEDLGLSGSISKELILLREQFYLNILFSNYKNQLINLSPYAGSTKGYKHKPEFIIKRSGVLNPMFGKDKSPEFIKMQLRDKSGVNNPQYGVIKTPETVAKLTKLVYVYNYLDMSFIGQFSTVNCSKQFKMGKDTLTKYIFNGLPFKGKIFSHKKLH
jgi:group I intron endonuclease